MSLASGNPKRHNVLTRPRPEDRRSYRRNIRGCLVSELWDRCNSCGDTSAVYAPDSVSNYAPPLQVTSVPVRRNARCRCFAARIHGEDIIRQRYRQKHKRLPSRSRSLKQNFRSCRRRWKKLPPADYGTPAPPIPPPGRPPPRRPPPPAPRPAPLLGATGASACSSNCSAFFC